MEEIVITGHRNSVPGLSLGAINYMGGTNGYGTALPAGTGDLNSSIAVAKAFGMMAEDFEIPDVKDLISDSLNKIKDRLSRDNGETEEDPFADRFGEGILVADEEIESLEDFIRNYSDLRDANTLNADKYFHCKANCEAAQRGQSGEEIANTLSNVREYSDILRGGSFQDYTEDQLANTYGRIRGAAEPNTDCPTLCNRFRPPTLAPQY